MPSKNKRLAMTGVTIGTILTLTGILGMQDAPKNQYYNTHRRIEEINDTLTEKISVEELVQYESHKNYYKNLIFERDSLINSTSYTAEKSQKTKNALFPWGIIVLSGLGSLVYSSRKL